MGNTFWVSSGNEDGAVVATRNEVAEIDRGIVSIIEENQPVFFHPRQPASSVRGRGVRDTSLGPNILEGGVHSLFCAGVDKVDAGIACFPKTLSDGDYEK
jgi:hypothetical protein